MTTGWRPLLGSALLAAALGGCGSSASTGGSASSQPVTSSASHQIVTVGKTFWHAGWKVTLSTATVAADQAGTPEVRITASFENLGTQTATFDSQVTLTSAGQNYVNAASDQQLPQVPGQARGAGMIALSVSSSFTFNDAVLLVGNPSHAQATVPLGQAGTLVGLEPRTLPVSGSAVAGALTLTVTGAELRSDLPDQHREVEHGKLALTLHFSALLSIRTIDVTLTEGVFSLKLPNGNTVAVRADGGSGPAVIMTAGTTTPDLFTRFDVDDPATGAYTWAVKGAYATDGSGTMVQGGLNFTIA